MNSEITLSLVSNLIAHQFPQWAHLLIRPVKKSGHDNRMFHLGNDMVIRLPSAAKYAQQIEKEQKWLPLLAPHLSLQIPEPLAMGNPSKDYPWHWSIYTWIEGESANGLQINNEELENIASPLAQFLSELHKIDTTDAPLPGAHNFYRGDSPVVYDAQTRLAIAQLRDIIDVDAATAVWLKAISSKWEKKPVWIPGDLSAENILIKDTQLVAVIDFGGMAVGDPACDLVIAWTFFKNESRIIFKNLVSLDSNTWARVRGWALWKALITLNSIKDKSNAEAKKQLLVINEILKEHGLEHSRKI